MMTSHHLNCISFYFQNFYSICLLLCLFIFHIILFILYGYSSYCHFLNFLNILLWMLYFGLFSRCRFSWLMHCSFLWVSCKFFVRTLHLLQVWLSVELHHSLGNMVSSAQTLVISGVPGRSCIFWPISLNDWI